MFHTWTWGGGMWFDWIFWLIIIGVIVWLIINQSNRNQVNSQSESPLDILKKRHAKAEITKQQFNQIKKDLE